MEELREVLKQHNYIPIEQIGCGAFGAVFKVHSTKYNETFVIKRIPNKKKNTCEIKTLMSVLQENIIRIYDFFNDNNFIYLVLEYCPNGSIANLIQNNGSSTDFDVLLKYIHEIVNALDHCHSMNIAHRDIKPSNILIDKYWRIKLADFGISDEFHPDVKLCTTFCGSFNYESPEILNKVPHDPFKADVWALGVTIFEMAFGESPWPQEQLSKLLSMSHAVYQIPTEGHDIIKTIIKRALVESPEKRASIKEIKALLDSYTETKGPTNGHTSYPQLIVINKKNQSRSIIKISKTNSSNHRTNIVLARLDSQRKSSRTSLGSLPPLFPIPVL